MDSIYSFFAKVGDFLWGPPMLILIMGTGFFLHIKMNFLPIRKALYGFRNMFSHRKNTDELEGDISPFAALMTSLSSAVGTGNIIGVATGISIGGPGALFWLVMSAIISLANKYTETLLGVHFRQKDTHGEQIGGPMYAIHRGLHKRWRFLAVMFAVFGTLVAIEIGAMLQSNGIANTLHSTMHVPLWLSAVVLTALVGIIILGGIKRIGTVASQLVPVMCISYILLGITTIIMFSDQLWSSIQLILHSAFHPLSAIGGFSGATVAMAMRYGVARGLSCNEAGLGTAGIAQSAGLSKSPVRSALIGMTGTFFDTLIVLTTGLSIILTGAWKEPGLSGSQYSIFAVKAIFPSWGGHILAIELIFFALTTSIGWAYYGEKCTQYLLGDKAVIPYRIVYTIAIFIGVFIGINPILAMGDLLNACMAIPNLISMILLAPLATKLTIDYFGTPKSQ